MSFHDEYRIVINEAQRRLILRALTNAMANDRRSSDFAHPTPDEWMQLIRLFSTIDPCERKPMTFRRPTGAASSWRTRPSQPRGWLHSHAPRVRLSPPRGRSPTSRDGLAVQRAP
jgi:hypothetical protein